MMKTKKILLALILSSLLISMIPITTSTTTPSVTTSIPATGIGLNNATIHGIITNDGGEESTVGFEYGLTTSYGTNVSPTPTYLYAGGESQTIKKYWESNLSTVATSASYGGWIYTITEDSTYVYAGGDTTQKVYQYWKSNMTKKAETGNYGGSIFSLTQDITYVYAGGDTTQNVYQYWKSNMTKKAETASYGGTIDCLAQDLLYVYAGGDTTQKVYQYWKSNMTKKAETGNYGGSIFSLTQDITYVYAGGDTTFRIYQYWKSNMTKKAQSSNYAARIWSITSDNTFLYAGGMLATYKIFQWWKSNMTKRTESTPSYGGSIDTIGQDSLYVYAGGAITKRVRQYWKTNMTYRTQSASYLGEILTLSISNPYQTGDTFSYNLNGLSSGTTYHYRAYAINSLGRDNGTDDEFTTLLALTPPTVTTDGANDITPTDEELVGTLTDDGGEPCSVWFEYGTTPSYGNISYIQPGLTSGDTVYITIGSLMSNTLYHYRAFANNTLGISSGTDETFTTLLALTPPTVTTDGANDITPTDEELVGTLTDDGGETCSLWFEYGTTPSYGNISNIQPGLTSGDTVYISIGSLLNNTLYHYKAFANNTLGISSGTDETFTTLDYYAPTVTTDVPPTGIGYTNATLPGYLDDDGYDACSVWFQYGTTTYYGSTTPHQTASTGDSFYANIHSLYFNTTYHYRTVARNSKGTTYGSDETFTTTSSGGTVQTNWTSIFDGISRMFTGGSYYDSQGNYHQVTGIFGGGFDTQTLLGIFLFMILFLLTAVWGLGIMIGSVAIIPIVFAVIGYIPELKIIVAIIVGLVFGLGINRLVRR